MVRLDTLLAAFQAHHGLLTTAEIRRLGVSRQQLRTLTSKGVVQRLRPGLWQLSFAPTDWQATAVRGCRLSSPSALVSHRSALRVWGLAAASPRITDIVVPHGRGRERPAPRVRVHRTRWLPDDDRCLHEGVPVTSVSRTLVDVARYLPDDGVAGSIGEALRRQLTTFEQLEARLKELSVQGRNGIARFREVLENLGPVGDSELERRAVALLRRAGIEPPSLQHPVTLGPHRYLLDLAWPAKRVAVECQGWLHHHTPEKSHADADRHNRLVAAGWTILYVTWQRVTREQWQFLADVRHHLDGGASLR